MRTKSNIKLSQCVGVAQRYQRSVNLSSDVGRDDVTRGYVVSPLVAQTIARIAHAAGSPSGARAWTLIGPYGTGKSAFAAYTAELLHSGKCTKSVELLRKVSPEAASAVLELRRKTKGLLPVPVVGRRTSIGRAVLEGLLGAAEQHWAGPGKKPSFLHAARSLVDVYNTGGVPDDKELASTVVEAATTLARSRASGGGLLLVIDELGKLLEWAAQHPEAGDIYLLQLLAEEAVRVEGATLVLIGILHQSFDAYARHLPSAARSEWAKTQGRFESVPFVEPAGHLVHLIGEALRWSEPTSERKCKQASSEACKLLAAETAVSNQLQEALCLTAPLNPTTAMALGPVIRQRLGQNERSLFSFLASAEPSGFADWASTAVAPSLYGPDLLFDYVRANSASFADSRSARHFWATAEEAIARLPATATDADEKVIKAIAVLSVATPESGVAPSPSVLQAALWPLGKSELTRALKRLEKASVVVYRRFRNAWQLWDGSDIDVDAAISEQHDRLRGQGGIASLLQAALPPPPITAPRHYYTSGTFRYFHTRYVDSDARALPGPQEFDADGVVYLVLPDASGRVADEDLERLCALADDAPLPSVVVAPTDPERLRAASLEVLASEEAKKRTAGLDGDRVARRELAVRREAAIDAFLSVRDRCFGLGREDSDVLWYYAGYEYAPGGQPSRTASEILDEVYAQAPTLKNELVNRRDLSTAAASARRELLERMLTHGNEARLGIKGHPAELSMYLSILEATGLHRKAGRNWAFGPPPPESPVFRVWTSMVTDLVAGGGQRTNLDDLYRRLMAAPFGVRAGVAPILFLAYFLVHESTLCIYEEGTFVPTVSPDLVHRLLRRPETFEVQQANAGGLTQHVCSSLAMAWGPATSGEASLLSIVRAVMRMVAGLSPFASKTRRVSLRAQRLRSAVQGARDPVRLILVDVPEALGLHPLTGSPRSSRVRSAVAEVVDRFHECRAELEAADRRLIGEAGETVTRLLGGGACTPEFLAELCDRAGRLADVIDLPPQLRRFAQITNAASSSSEAGLEEWIQDVATLMVGKPATHWHDDDLQAFAHAAMRVCRSFLSAEQLSLELKTMKASSTRVVRVSVLSAEGDERSGIAVLRSEDDARVERFIAGVRALAESEGIADTDISYAVISALLDSGPERVHARGAS